MRHTIQRMQLHPNKLKITNIEGNVTKSECICTVDENVKGYSRYGKQFLKNFKIKILKELKAIKLIQKFYIWHGRSPKEIKFLRDFKRLKESWRDMCTLLFTAALFTTGKNVKANQGYIHKWIHKLNVYIQSSIFQPSNKKKFWQLLQYVQTLKNYVKPNKLITTS